MKRQTILALLLVFTASIVLADDISEEQALQTARAFAVAQTAHATNARKAPVAITPTLAYTVKSEHSDKANVYIVNLGGDQGFVVVSGETGTTAAVLGYCDQGTFSYDDAPCNLKALLQQYAGQIDCLRENSNLTPRSSLLAPRSSSSVIGNVVVEPLVKTKWDQEEPFNNQCPIVNEFLTPTGCGATAMAQVMAFWKYPKYGRGSYSYYWNPSYNTRFDYGRDFSNSVYDWDNMLDDYTGGYTEAQGEAVALLMADVGAAMHTIYGYGLFGSMSQSMRCEIVFPKYFDYNPDSIRFVRRYLNLGNGETDNFDEFIKQDLDKQRPVILAAHPSPDMDGHFIVVDGYTDTGYFHMNFGWSGDKDGYYLTTIIDVYYDKSIENRRHFSWLEQQLIYGICPSYSTREGDNYYYIADGQAILNHSEASEAINVPASITVDGTTYPVTKISRMACYENETLTSIQLPSSIKEIGERAFYNCGNLTTIAAPDNTSRGLTENYLPDQLTTLGDYAFARSGLTDITVPASLQRVADYAFYRCSNLSLITVLSKEVGSMAFGRCSKKPDVYSSAETLGDGAFFYDGVSDIFLGRVKHIGNDCLSGSNLSYVDLSNIETIGWNLGMVMPGGTVYVGSDAPVTSLRRYAPLDYTTTIIIDNDNPNFVAINNTVFSKDRKTLLHFGWKDGQPNEYGIYETRRELTVPSSVERVADFAIGDNRNLHKLTIPATVRTIGVGNFPNGAEVFNYSTTPQPVKLLDESYLEGCTMDDELIDVGAQSYGTTNSELDKLLNQAISATLHVPAGCKEAYAAADVWKNFTNIIDDLTAVPTAIEVMSSDGFLPDALEEGSDIQLYSLDGKLVYSGKVDSSFPLPALREQSPIYILKAGDKTFKFILNN